MAFKPNYNLQRADRNRAARARSEEKQKKKEEKSAQRKAERREHEIRDDNPFYVRDYSQCVLCWRCVQVCAEDAQYTFALTFDERGFNTHISTAFA